MNGEKKKIPSKTAGSHVGLAGNFLTEEPPLKLGDSYFFNLLLSVALHPFPWGSGRHKSWTLHGFVPTCLGCSSTRMGWPGAGSGGRGSSQCWRPAASPSPGIPGSQCLRLPKANKPGSSEIYQAPRGKMYQNSSLLVSKWNVKPANFHSNYNESVKWLLTW